MLPDEVIPLTDADLIEEPAATPLTAAPTSPPMARPISPAGEVIYPAESAALQRPLRPARYKPPATKPAKKTKKHASRDAAATMGFWVAGFVFLFSLLPGCIVLILAMINYSKHGMFG